MKTFKQLINEGILFDSHCHFNSPEYDNDRNEVVERADNLDVKFIFDIGINADSSLKAVENSKKIPSVIASVGVDMETCIPGSDIYMKDQEKVFKDFETIKSLVENKATNNIEMIGETGIDLYWLNKENNTKESILESLEVQKELFHKHIELSIENDLPLSIHSRNAYKECKVELTKYSKPFGVFHSLTPETNDNEIDYYNRVCEIIEMGFYVGVNGIFTFKNAHMLRNTYLKILKEKTGKSNKFELRDWYVSGFVFETDGPYLAPEGHRGERNESGFIAKIISFQPIGNSD